MKKLAVATVVLLAALAACKKKEADKAPTATGPGSAGSAAMTTETGSAGSAGSAAEMAGWDGKTPLTLEGFQTPESVLFDADADLYLVSNINGQPLDVD